MDINFNKEVGFPSKGFILDILIQGLGVNLPRKKIQRLILEEDSSQTSDKLIDEIIKEVVDMIFIEDSKELTLKVQLALISFFKFYTEFSNTIETYAVSQKQLDYLLLKDLFIPLAADISAGSFNQNILILEIIKPTKDMLPIPKLFAWIKEQVPHNDIFEDYLVNIILNNETPVKVDYKSLKSSVDSWIKDGVLPEVKSINLLVENLTLKINSDFSLKSLFLTARIMQKYYLDLRKNYNHEYIELLVEHYYLLLKFYDYESKPHFEHDSRSFIFNTLFSHINPEIVNRNFYWDDYFLSIIEILYNNNINKNDLVKEVIKRNGMLYNLDEATAFKYMKLFLPVNILIQKEAQDTIVDLRDDLMSFVENREKVMSKAYACKQWYDGLILISDPIKKFEYLMMRLFIMLRPTETKTFQDKNDCIDIFEIIKKDFMDNENNPNINMLQSRYYAYCGDFSESLKYCKKCVENGEKQLGSNIIDVITEGLLLSAKQKRKRDFNFFYKWAERKNILENGLLKVPTNTNLYLLFNISEEMKDFSKLSEECERYFSNGFK